MRLGLPYANRPSVPSCQCAPLGVFPSIEPSMHSQRTQTEVCRLNGCASWIRIASSAVLFEALASAGRVEELREHADRDCGYSPATPGKASLTDGFTSACSSCWSVTTLSPSPPVARGDD